jgi:2-oxo-hept-3-ene-1,7-dioate hydratase
MMDAGAVEQAAASLDEAERTRRQIGLLSLAHPGMDMDDAYGSSPLAAVAWAGRSA